MLINKTLSEEYFKDQYKMAMSDFLCSHSENDQWEARKRMAKLERLASEMYGFDFSDKLRQEATKEIFFDT